MWNRNIQVLLFIRILTNIADSLYIIATIWYIKEMYQSPMWIGIAGFVTTLPHVLQIFFGPLIDYFPKKKILLYSEGIQAVIFLIVTVLYYTDSLHVVVLLLLVFIAEMFSLISYPTEEVLVPGLVPEKDLIRVNSVFTFTYNSLDLIGNALSGILIALVGTGVIFFSNSIVFTFTFFFIWIFLKLPQALDKGREMKKDESILPAYKRDLREGILYLWNRQTLRKVLLSFTIVNLMISMALSLIPIFEDSVGRYGLWMTAISVGVVTGSLLVNFIEKINLRKILISVSFVTGFSWLISIYFLEKSFILTLLFFGVAWAMIGITEILMETMVQVNVDMEYMGRSNTVIGTMLGVFAPLGHLFGGTFATIFSPILLFSVGGITYLCLSAYFLVNPNFRKLGRVDEAFEEVKNPYKDEDEDEKEAVNIN
ncbi:MULTISPECIES: MFS transporter [Bacillus cereus group]|uniref:MFS transporter n=1 Tax=Bacillus cereus group TaxID=86661 RepID=UPI001F55E92B|nr:MULTISPECIES: MFS transporter [Bacillus cereus group]MDM5265149.1 MFS transporter [Bacillus wiedmannii]